MAIKIICVFVNAFIKGIERNEYAVKAFSSLLLPGSMAEIFLSFVFAFGFGNYR
jgi:hypothetical protein